MRKIITIFSDHSHNLIRNLIIFIILLGIFLFALFRVGFSIESLRLPSYNLKGLYIKLNKNLLLLSSIDSLYIKEHNITLSGDLKYDLYRDTIDIKAKVSLEDILIDINASKIHKDIKFSLTSNEFAQLRAIIDKFALQEVHRDWILHRVETQKYKIISIKGEAHKEDDGYSINMNSLKGEVFIDDAKVHFQKSLKPILTDSVTLNYRDNSLYFKLDNPMYEGKSLQGSKVAIKDITKANPILKLDIKMKTPFDKTMNRLLDSYNVNIPVKQKKGRLKAAFHADIALVEGTNNYIVDVKFGKGDIMVHSVRLPITNGSLRYANNSIKLSNIKLKDKSYQGVVNGNIDLDRERVKLVFNAKHISLGKRGNRVFVLKNRKLPIVLDYRKNIKIDIPKLALKLSIKNKKTTIKITNLNKIKPYLIDKTIVEKGGYVTIETRDFKKFSFKGMVKKPSSFLYEKRQRCQSTIKFNGKITPKGESFYAFNKRFYYNEKRSQLKIKNLNIDLKRLLKNKSKSRKKGKKLIIIGKNSHLRYGKYSLLTDSYDIEIKPNGNIEAIGSAGGDIIKFSKKRNKFTIQAFRIKDKVLHPLINFNGLTGGRYSIKKIGNPDKMMKGEIIIEGGVMKDFKAYNNTLAFINTIPALAVLHNPGFSKKGFEIKEGVIEYRMIGKNKIVFDKIYIKGISANIVGKGSIDIKRNKIKMNLAIQVGRTLGKVIGNIPLLGYILMGKDKSITVGLKITGNLNKPTVTTSVASDILSLPLQLIKRTLLAPKVLGNRGK
ncbi:MAG: AsmA-like C-terminal domain-containing protein [Sulfurovum sp.]